MNEEFVNRSPGHSPKSIWTPSIFAKLLPLLFALQLDTQKISLVVRWSVVLVGLYFVFQIFSAAYALVSGNSAKDLIWLFAGELSRDSQDRTNFLLLGEGGSGHPGGELTDTFLIASYSHRYGTIALLSIPRDFWTFAGDGQGMRVNRLHDHETRRLGDSRAGLEATAKAASRIVDLPIHYYAQIDFSGFIDLVDTLGGIQVTVETAINDPHYPCPNMVDFCTFQISAGTQTLDGATALQYARSRKTTSDFDRAARQQQILTAIRQKAFDREMLTSPTKLKAIYEALSDHLVTNLRFRELIKLGKIADEFNSQNIASIVLSDDPSKKGGLLYAGTRADYGGASVVVPVGDDYSQLHTLSEILFGHPRILTDGLTIEVLNGTTKPGVASNMAYYLTRLGLEVPSIDNASQRDLTKTRVYFYDSERSAELMTTLKGLLTAEFVAGTPEYKRRGYDLTIVVGEDWREPK